MDRFMSVCAQYRTTQPLFTYRDQWHQWHIYAGLAIPNPSARGQINQFSKSMTELFKPIKRADKEDLRSADIGARDVVSTGRRGI